MPPKRVPISRDIENLIQEACTQLRAQAKPNISDVIRKIKARSGVTLPYHTVRNRFLGKHVSLQQAHASQQLLLPEVEQVLVGWIIYLSDTGQPQSKWTIRKKAEAICGKKPSESWVVSFLRRHPEVKLDLKRAQAYDLNDSDDESSSDSANESIIGDTNSQTKTPILPCVSRPFPAPVLSHRPPLAPPVVPNPTMLPICTLSASPEPISPCMACASTIQPKRKRVARRPTNPVQAQRDTLSQTYIDLSKQNVELRSEISRLKAFCAIAETEIQDIKRQLDAKENRRQKRRKLNVEARWLNSNENPGLADEQEEIRATKEQKKRHAREQPERVGKLAKGEE